MSVKTIKSEAARIKMRDILDEVTAGGEVIIERYHKPVGVVIPHALWKHLKQLQQDEIARIRKEMEVGEKVTAPNPVVVSCNGTLQDQVETNVGERIAGLHAGMAWVSEDFDEISLYASP